MEQDAQPPPAKRHRERSVTAPAGFFDTEAGARQLADSIRAYWLRQGYNVVPAVAATRGTEDAHWHVVLPTFPNGHPPRECFVGRRRG